MNSVGMTGKKFAGKVSLVTGAGSGIGRASAIAFGREEALVVVVDIDAEGGRNTAKTIVDSGGTAMFLRADVSLASDVRDMVGKVIDTYGRIDFAHNNVGVEGDVAKTAQCSEENWDRVIGTNLKSMWLCLKYEIPPMITQKRGAIVNTASIYGLLGCERGLPAYAASKHGVIGLTRTAALEYAESGIRVNAVCPGAVNTPFRKRIVAKSGGSCSDTSRYPVGRIAEPHEIASTVIWLCSDEASFITGSTMVVDGGLSVR